MSNGLIRSAAFAASVIAALTVAAPASAQQSVMKECGSRWQAAKAAKQTEGQTWRQFLAKCRAELAAKPESSTSASAPPSSTTKQTRRSTRATTGKATERSGEMVFPTRVDPKYAQDSAGVARRKTCLEQYNANKQSKGGAGNGGKRWIEKGGGYYSECNKHLKGG